MSEIVRPVGCTSSEDPTWNYCIGNVIEGTAVADRKLSQEVVSLACYAKNPERGLEGGSYSMATLACRLCGATQEVDSQTVADFEKSRALNS